MKFTYLDFYLLESISSGKDALSDVACDVCLKLPDIPSKTVLEGSVSKLVSADLAVWDGGRLVCTDKTKDFFKDKKFLESKAARARRLMLKLCELDAQSADFSLSDADYDSVARHVRETYEIHPSLALENNTLYFKCEEGECDDDCVSVTSASFEITNFPLFAKSILQVCGELISPSKARKLCVETADASYVLILFCEGDAVRIKAQKILFNRKRFSGKLNSDLDYAQCGDTALNMTCSKAEFFECVALISLHAEESFTDTDYENLNKITL